METEIKEASMQKNLIESALFMSAKPLQMEELSRITGIGSVGYLKELIKDLQKDYSEKGVEISGTAEGWQMKVKKEYLPHVANLTPHVDLSEGCKKTLALTLYNEPLKQSHLVKTQGNKSYVYVKELEKKGLIKSERSGHTKILRVSAQFENYFGETKEEVKKRLLEAMDSMDAGEPAPLLDNTDSELQKPSHAEDRLVSLEKEDIKQAAETHVTEDDEALEIKKPENKNLKPIKREKPVKIPVRKDGKNRVENIQEEKTESKPINKVVAKQDLSKVKELTVDDLKK